MTFSQIAAAVRLRFKTCVADVRSDVPVAWDNAPFDPPDSAAWLQVNILPGKSRQVSFGANPDYRHEGMLIVSVRIPIELGTAAALDLADLTASAFTSVTDSGVTFRTPELVRLGASGPWWQMNVNCPFYAGA